MAAGAPQKSITCLLARFNPAFTTRPLRTLAAVRRIINPLSNAFPSRHSRSLLHAQYVARHVFDASHINRKPPGRATTLFPQKDAFAPRMRVSKVYRLRRDAAGQTLKKPGHRIRTGRESNSLKAASLLTEKPCLRLDEQPCGELGLTVLQDMARTMQ